MPPRSSRALVFAAEFGAPACVAIRRRRLVEVDRDDPALRLLRDEGLVELRPGHGIRVSGTPQRGAPLAKAVKLSRASGYNRAELLAIIEQLP